MNSQRNQASAHWAPADITEPDFSKTLGWPITHQFNSRQRRRRFQVLFPIAHGWLDRFCVDNPHATTIPNFWNTCPNWLPIALPHVSRLQDTPAALALGQPLALATKDSRHCASLIALGTSTGHQFLRLSLARSPGFMSPRRRRFRSAGPIPMFG
jgi:hypothetical protein